MEVQGLTWQQNGHGWGCSVCSLRRGKSIGDGLEGYLSGVGEDDNTLKPLVPQHALSRCYAVY